jgi:error-prone DNA polymerase
MTARFNNYPLGFYSAATLVKDAQRHGLHFLALDINKSQYEFKVEEVNCEKQVRLGLNYVRGLREVIGRKIVAERDAIYTSIEDLVRRVPEINKREVRALSLAGALNFEGNIHRREALWQSRTRDPTFRRIVRKCQQPARNYRYPLPHTHEGLDLIDADLRKTGISIGKHPMAFVREEMRKKGILSAEDALNLKAGDVVSVAGAVINPPASGNFEECRLYHARG